MKKFELIIKNERIKQYRLLAIFIIVINLVFFIWLAISNPQLRISALVTAAIIITGFAIEYFTNKYSATATGAFFIILFYVESGYWQGAVIIALLALMYMISIRQLIVLVNSNHILYPSFPKKLIEWGELNNMILKDGLLTIDFKNNKIAQATIINGENDYDIDEKEFNEFCKMQLTSNNTVTQVDY